MWYEFVISKLQYGKTYRRADIVSILKEEKGDLSNNSYIWAIGNLVKMGALQHTGRNQYSLPDGKQKNIYCPLYSEEAKNIRNKIEKKYPRVGFTIFESVLLNEFLNHQIARNTIFVQAEREISAFVFDFLRKNTDKMVMYRPSRKEYSRYWQPDSVVILDWTSEAPLGRTSPHDVTIEKMLVDIFCDKTIQLTYSSAEYKNMVAVVYERYRVDTVRLLRYARRRHREKEIREFIPQK